MIETFHLRSQLYRHYDELTEEQKDLLKKYDENLLEISEKVYEHVKRIYDFNNDKPKEEWWWHLDQVVDHKLSVDLKNGTVTTTYLSTTVDFASKEEYDLFLNWSRDKQIVIREKNKEDRGII